MARGPESFDASGTLLQTCGYMFWSVLCARRERERQSRPANRNGARGQVGTWSDARPRQRRLYTRCELVEKMQAIRAAARPLTLSAARTAAVPRVAAGQSLALFLLRGSSVVGTQTTDALALPACVHILSRLGLISCRLCSPPLPAHDPVCDCGVTHHSLLPTHPHLTSHSYARPARP